MRTFYANTSGVIRCEGWGVLKVEAEFYGTLWVVERYQIINPYARYDMDWLMDLAGYFPLYWFATEYEAKYFCGTNSPALPVERQLYFLRCSPDYWLQSVLDRLTGREPWPLIEYAELMNEYYRRFPPHRDHVANTKPTKNKCQP